MPQRYFFALWPCKKLQKQYFTFSHQTLKSVHGKFVPKKNLHMTLAFLGELNNKQLEEIFTIGNTIIAERFELDLDRLGLWKQSQVVWLAPSYTPLPLKELVSQLQQKLKDRGFTIDQRSFKPHMTLLRKAKHKPPAVTFQPLAWQVDDFVLVKSTLCPEGAKYEVIKQWPLKSPDY